MRSCRKSKLQRKGNKKSIYEKRKMQKNKNSKLHTKTQGDCMQKDTELRVQKKKRREDVREGDTEEKQCS